MENHIENKKLEKTVTTEDKIPRANKNHKKETKFFSGNAFLIHIKIRVKKVARFFDPFFDQSKNITLKLISQKSSKCDLEQKNRKKTPKPIRSRYSFRHSSQQLVKQS